MRITTRSVVGALLAIALAELLLRSQALRLGLGEGSAVSHWNIDGSRAAPPAPAGAPVVLAIGDSFTEALQVNDDEVFTAIAQRRLASLGAASRFVNIGRGAHSPADYVALAPIYLRRFQTRWTVVEINEPDLEGDSFDESKTHFVRTPAGLAVVQVVPNEGRMFRMLRAGRDVSALFDRVIGKASSYRNTARMPPMFRAADLGPYEAGLPEWSRRRWPVADDLDRMRTAYGGRVTFLYLPEFPRPGVPMAEGQFNVWCAQRGASCINLRSVFTRFRVAGTAPYGFANGTAFGVGHLNQQGHRAAAELVASELQRMRQRGLF